MLLKVRNLNWYAGRPVVILNKRTAEILGANVNERVSLKNSSGDILAILDLASGFVKEDEIAISKEVEHLIKIEKNGKLDVGLAPLFKSLNLIKKKMMGEHLNKKDIEIIIQEISDNSLPEADISLFVSAVYRNGMSLQEITYLIESFLHTGKRLSIPGKIIADKHCIGGIAGNRTTPLVVSICAAAGLTFPKTSSRAITSAAGTSDTIELLAPVDFTLDQLKKIIKKTNAFMVWGGSFDLLPADTEILRVEKMLRLDVTAFLLASILSKKISMGSTHVLIDIPYGKSAKVDKLHALILKKEFEYLARKFKLKLKCVLTDGSQPIGNGIGPVLELMDIINILKGKHSPSDLEKKAIFLSGQLLELTGKAKKGAGEKLAQDILSSGKAFEKFKEIIHAQGGKISSLSPAKFSYDVLAKRTGKIREINNRGINELARVSGCPSDKTSGVYLYFHVGDKINKGEKILTIYSESKFRLGKAIEFYNSSNAITLN